MSTRLRPLCIFLILCLFPAALASAQQLQAPAAQQLQTPSEFLGYEPGEHFTPHHQVLSYVKHVAEHSDRTTLQHYGESYGRRDLVYLIVSSPGNHEHMEEIRLNNLRLTGLEGGELTERQRAIIWLSYNVHGNEPSSSEAAMKTLYELADPANSESGVWLENSVVILDPMLNPDGRERYVNWYQQMEGIDFNPDPDAREHHEEWPGGRSNHYYFDLNRDWAWQTQLETRQRVNIYQEWMPHVHVDFHEQYYTDPYYFAPAAEPFHEAITGWQREFQTMIGQNHMRYFDEQGWLYFTRERFDLFYPSYGDTWPTFNGAIGMTYEQAGHSMAGRGILTPEGEVLTLGERLNRHHITGLSTVEVVSREAERVIQEFGSHFDQAQNDPAGPYRTYVVKRTNHPDRIYSLLSYLDEQKIQYGAAGSSQDLNGYNYQTGQDERVQVESDDIIISSYQPQSQLVRVLFEPQPALSDSLTYDITAWEAHYRFGVEGYALEERIDPEESRSPGDYRGYQESGNLDNAYSYIVRWESMEDARFLAGLLQEGILARFSMVPFTIDGRDYDRGTLVITRSGNREVVDFDETVTHMARKYDRHLHGTETGFVSSGSDFGSANIQLIRRPAVAVLAGEGTSSTSAGEIWHFFDHQLGYPATLLDTGHFQQADLNKYDVLILPSGDYQGKLEEAVASRLYEWIEAGGSLVVIGEANHELIGKEGFGIALKPNDTEPDEKPDELLQTFGDQAREAVQTMNPGSIYRITLDQTHPLSFGYSGSYASMKLSAEAFAYLEDGWNVGTTRADAHVSGFVGNEAKSRLEHSLTFGVQEIGDGSVSYLADNPLFRGFWENGKLLFVNAVFFVGQ